MCYDDSRLMIVTQSRFSAQMRRCDLKEEDLLPTSADNRMLHDDAVRYVMNFLVTHLKCLSHLKDKLPKNPTPSHPVKSQIVPLEILDIDEASTDNNIRILEQFCKDVCKDQSLPQV